MANDKTEPQSYGSQDEWNSGHVAQSVNPQKQQPPAEHAEFYDSRHESEHTAPNRGGEVSPEQRAENVAPQHDDRAVEIETHDELKGVTNRQTGYFRKRDFE